MESIKQIFQWLRTLFEYPLINLGDTTITLRTLTFLLVLLVLLFFIVGRLQRWIDERLLAKTGLEVGVRKAVATITRYVALFIGVLIALQTVGINLTTLNVLAGAIGIGLGFGLQNVANNFISGLIILFERPIKIGDRVEVGDIDGEVIEIGSRSTTVLTNDSIAIIVPNSKFITENIINWKYTDSKIRFKIPVGVAYDTDVRLVEKLLLEVAKDNKDVLNNPEPTVRFEGFGESSLNFILLVWNKNLINRRGRLMSDINFAIFDKLKQHDIEIPFPQRDLHIRSGPIDIKSGSSIAEAFSHKSLR